MEVMIFCAFLCAIANGYDGEPNDYPRLEARAEDLVGSLMTAIIAVRVIYSPIKYSASHGIYLFSLRCHTSSPPSTSPPGLTQVPDRRSQSSIPFTQCTCDLEALRYLADVVTVL